VDDSEVCAVVVDADFTLGPSVVDDGGVCNDVVESSPPPKLVSPPPKFVDAVVVDTEVALGPSVVSEGETGVVDDAS
jgi:hypothetical protein